MGGGGSVRGQRRSVGGSVGGGVRKRTGNGEKEGDGGGGRGRGSGRGRGRAEGEEGEMGKRKGEWGMGGLDVQRKVRWGLTGGGRKKGEEGRAERGRG